MNNVVADRVEGNLEKWLKREQRFQKIFPGPLANNRSFLKEKLKYYGTLNSRYGNMANQEERITLRLVREDRKAIERQLYPNAFVRLAYRLYSSIQKENEIHQEQRRKEVNLHELKASALRLGFPSDAISKGHMEALSKNLREPISFTYQIAANESMAFHWDLSGEDGAYRLKGYRATLTKEGEPDRSHNFTLNGTDGITAAQAYNLLSGRSVEIGKEGNRHWIKLDLNDKSLKGDHQVKRFYPGYGYDLEKALRHLPIRELKYPEQKRELLQDLRNGQRREVTLMVGNGQQQITVEANPQFKSLNLYDNKGKKISHAKALKGKKEKRNALRNNLMFKSRHVQKNGLRL